VGGGGTFILHPQRQMAISNSTWPQIAYRCQNVSVTNSSCVSVRERDGYRGSKRDGATETEIITKLMRSRRCLQFHNKLSRNLLRENYWLGKWGGQKKGKWNQGETFNKLENGSPEQQNSNNNNNINHRQRKAIKTFSTLIN